MQNVWSKIADPAAACLIAWLAACLTYCLSYAILPGEAFAYRTQTTTTESAPQGHAMHASHHGGHSDDAMTEKCGKPTHCPHCSTTDKCPKACVVLCAIGMTLSLAANTQPPYNIPAAHLPWTFVPPDTSPPHTSRLLRPPIA